MQKVGFNFFATEKAVQEVLRIAQENNITEPILRIRVVPGGCSGFQYAMGFDDTIEEGDNVFEFGGLKIAIDQFSMPYVNNAELDYVMDFMGGGFTIKNPTYQVPVVAVALSLVDDLCCPLLGAFITFTLI